jgi:hypothetical protein
MSDEDKRKCGTYCEICNMKPATQIKGGTYKEVRKMWMCCKDCMDNINDERAR